MLFKLCVVFVIFFVNRQLNAENSTINSGNELWDSLLNECTKSYKLSCIQKNVYTYLNSNLEYQGDYKVIDEIIFKPNKVDYTKYSKEANEIDPNEDDLEGERAFKSPLEEVTDSLYGKSVKFMMTHDLQLKMPDMMFEGATLKVQPRAFEGNGMWMYVEMVPREIFDEEEILKKREVDKVVDESRGIKDVPKLFKKKIQQFFKNKLLMSFMALMVVVKLIKFAIMFLLPVLVGVGTAKKIILKVLLFLFPALAHLFKLCSYYHADYHATKYHHHHHQIAHVHHENPGHYHYGPPASASHGPYHAASSNPPEFELGPPYPGSELNKPPHIPHTAGLGHSAGISLHHAPDIHIPGSQKLFEHESDPFELSGPGLGPEFISNRNSDFIPGPNDANEIKSWGLEFPSTTKLQPQTSSSKKVVTYARPPTKAAPPTKLTKNQIAELALKAEKEVLLKTRLQQEKLRLQQENLRLQEQLKSQENLKIHQQLKLHEALKQQERLKLADQTTKIIQQYQYSPQIPPIPPQYPTASQFTAPQAQPSINVPIVVAPVPVSSNRNPITQTIGISKIASPNSITAGTSYQAASISAQQLNVKGSASAALPVSNSAGTSSKGETTFTIQKSISSEYDQFYSPILEKIDAIFIKLGVHSEGCRERLICSMYKNPTRFSPHSNLLSAELSRDSKELQKPTSTNAPVIRFYRYVQAARDGQEKQDCLKSYPTCSFATEK